MLSPGSFNELATFEGIPAFSSPERMYMAWSIPLTL